MNGLLPVCGRPCPESDTNFLRVPTIAPLTWRVTSLMRPCIRFTRAARPICNCIRGEQAASEFHKLVEHRAAVVNLPLGALAHLQLGRAHALAGDGSKARTAYQDFFVLWKDADPDIPILKQAKAEFAKLR